MTASRGRTADSRIRPILHGAAMGLLLLLSTATGAAAQQDFDAAVARDLSRWRTGFVVALLHQDALQFFEAHGSRAALPDSALSTEDRFPFPAFTEILLGVTVEALHNAQLLDADGPISRYVPELDSVVGTATLRELLTHTAGLDNAGRVEGESWERTLDRIDDRALVALPGTIYSESRHSIPLAIRVLERAVDAPFHQVVTTAILGPLAMSASGFSLREATAEGLVQGVRRSDDAESLARLVPPQDTVRGLPVFFTTASDVLVFLSRWMDGGLRGRSPLELATAEHPREDRRYGGGVWVDRWRGQRRVSRVAGDLGTSAGFVVLPDTRTVLLVWSVGEWPASSWRFVLDRVGEAIGASPDSPPPDEGGEAGSGGARPVDPRRWSGTYRNGDLIFELRESGGALVLFDGSRELALRASGEAAVTAVLPDGRDAVHLELRTDAAGGRYLYFGNLAYRHGDDPIGG